MSSTPSHPRLAQPSFTPRLTRPTLATGPHGPQFGGTGAGRFNPTNPTGRVPSTVGNPGTFHPTQTGLRTPNTVTHPQVHIPNFVIGAHPGTLGHPNTLAGGNKGPLGGVTIPKGKLAKATPGNTGINPNGPPIIPNQKPPVGTHPGTTGNKNKPPVVVIVRPPPVIVRPPIVVGQRPPVIYGGDAPAYDPPAYDPPVYDPPVYNPPPQAYNPPPPDYVPPQGPAYQPVRPPTYQPARPLVAAVPPQTPAPPPTANEPPPGQPTGTFVIVGFQPNVTKEDVDMFLKAYNVTITDGPSPEGLYRIQLSEQELAPDMVTQVIDSMRSQTTIVASATNN